MQLKKLQQQFADDIKNLTASINLYNYNKDFSAKELISVYHNNYIYTLIDTLKSSYNCIFRLVGNDFFNYIAKKYIKNNPQRQGYLQNYGDNFSSFIASVPECKNMPYLVDIALLERYYELCYHSNNTGFDFAKLPVGFSKNINKYDKILPFINDCYVLSSKYPILDIWRLNENSSNLDLAKSCDNVLIYKYNDRVCVISLSKLDYKFIKINYNTMLLK